MAFFLSGTLSCSSRGGARHSWSLQQLLNPSLMRKDGANLSALQFPRLMMALGSCVSIVGPAAASTLSLQLSHNFWFRLRFLPIQGLSMGLGEGLVLRKQ